MFRFVYDTIKLYNARERRVHLTEASTIGFVKNLHSIVGINQCLSCRICLQYKPLSQLESMFTVYTNISAAEYVYSINHYLSCRICLQYTQISHLQILFIILQFFLFEFYNFTDKKKKMLEQKLERSNKNHKILSIFIIAVSAIAILV